MSRYKNELEEIFAREDAFRQKFWKPLILAGVVATTVFALSVSFAGNIIAGGADTSVVEILKVDQEDIDQAKQDRDEAEAQAAEAAAMVSSLKSQKSSLSGELAALNEANEEQKAQYELICSQLEAALEAKAQALDDYIQAEENLEAQQLLFSERVSAMFEYQNKSTLEVLLESDNIAGFFTNMEIITLIADADAQAIDQMQIALDDAELQKEIKLQEAEDMQAIADQKQAELDELEELIATTEDTLSYVSSQLSTWEQQEDELEAYAASLNDQILALQSEYNTQQAAQQPAQPASSGDSGSGSGSTSDSGSSSGDSGSSSSDSGSSSSSGGGSSAPSNPSSPSISVSLQWPASGYISSPFGYRYHPVYGTYKFHSGIDIACGYGSAICAAASGTVIYVTEPVEGCNTGGSGYGNYCIIDHGDGVTTLYAHARDIYVSVGDYVSAGQQIGEVGSTGTSTGAHLHFEVRVNGTQYNPEDYLP